MLASTVLAASISVETSSADTPSAQPRAVAVKETRALVSIRSLRQPGNFVSWRLLRADGSAPAFNVYRNGVKINADPITKATSYLDLGAPADASYEVRLVGDTTALRSGVRTRTSSIDVPLQLPKGGTTPSGEAYTYTAGDASVGDLDGDGVTEIVLKWDPSNAKDNSQAGYTGNVLLDAYRLDGTRLWRIDLGSNIRAGAHYTQFQVFDFDGDGKAEVAMKTADGTRSGTGQVIGNAKAYHRTTDGYVLSGPEYLSVFRGTDGAVLATADFAPARGSVASWGDDYGNRVDRFLAGTAYLDGVRPSIIMARGYYKRSAIAAWDFRDGVLVNRWVFDSAAQARPADWMDKGNHQLSVADVDGDGRDEIAYGSMAIDDNGRGMWQNNTHHGDAYHVGDFIPSRPGFEVFKPSESKTDVADWMGDARTGRIIWSAPSCGCDNGRAVAADIWPDNPGAEVWSAAVDGLRSATTGAVVSARKPGSANFVVWWDGDAERELLNGTTIDKYSPSGELRLLTGQGVQAANGTKATPALSADILGDWREEVVWRTADSTALRIYTTTEPTTIRRLSLMEDRQYRLAVAWQNSAYNQPPHPSFARP
ncbi:rhamnogalacturonan lyase [Lentzea sp. HUAS12]|uniref:rhamnogalacturonan lyase n=1 Tax=Lentzea sp. HUAS12 TaxID=2951806 RepID=UPI0020A03C1B|nr:rhamnogalacturonan lyase [Lentzea sp. HUAS12]USX56315.1 rhamnogalacturonan lyase [Lentzea sp. HUAS12]